MLFFRVLGGETSTDPSEQFRDLLDRSRFCFHENNLVRSAGFPYCFLRNNTGVLMKAAIVNGFGQPPYCAGVAEPQPAADKLVGTVRAAAIKNIERQLVAGTHYGSGHMTMPARLGIDAVVELPDGRRVYAGAAPPDGTMAEFLAVDPEQVVEVPDGVDDASAAALPNAAVSAWVGLEYAGRIAQGHNVLVLGATGVTGGLAVALAKRRFGADRVVAVGRNRKRLAQLAEQGADDVIVLHGNANGLAEEGTDANSDENADDTQTRTQN